MLLELITAIQKAHLDMTAEEIAEALWLALWMKDVESKTIGESQEQEGKPSRKQERDNSDQKPSQDEPISELYPYNSKPGNKSGSYLTGLPFRSPAATALPNKLALARAIRPLMQRQPSKTIFTLNEDATAQRIAEMQKRIWSPVLDPAPTRWFDVALVVDESASMTLWHQTVIELRLFLESHGAFRDVRIWNLATDDSDGVYIYTGNKKTKAERHIHHIKELIDPSNYRLIIVVTDCVSKAWYDGQIARILDMWGKMNSVVLVHMFPRRLWLQTALRDVDIVSVYTQGQSVANSEFKVRELQRGFSLYSSDEQSSPIPIVTLEQKSLADWARMVTGHQDAWVPSAVFSKNPEFVWDESPLLSGGKTFTPKQRVQLFYANASFEARRLAGWLAAASIPLNLNIIRLVQYTMLNQKDQVHIAEILLGGLLEETYRDEENNDPAHVVYDFIPGVREELCNAVPISDAYRVVQSISTFIKDHYALARDFIAVLAMPFASKNGLSIAEGSTPFAQFEMSALRHFGGVYASLVENLEQQIETLSHQPAENDRKPHRDPKILDAPQEYLPSIVKSSLSFSSKMWCGLTWTPWYAFGSSDIKLLPTSSGIYRIKAIDDDTIYYIGYTGRNVRERINDLVRNTNSTQMPFNDPHTAAPSLWAWRDATGVDFVCSAVSVPSETNFEILVSYLLWQYRLEYGSSTLCNHGRFHHQYIKSSDRQTGRRGYRLPDGERNRAGEQSYPALKLNSTPSELDWMGLRWSHLHSLQTTITDTVGSPSCLYKIVDADNKQLLFVGSSTNLKSRLQALTRKNWDCSNPVIAFSNQSNNILPHQFSELVNDLLGGYYEQTKMAPKFQFKNVPNIPEDILLPASKTEDGEIKTIQDIHENSSSTLEKPTIIGDVPNITEDILLSASKTEGAKNPGQNTLEKLVRSVQRPRDTHERLYHLLLTQQTNLPNLYPGYKSLAALLQAGYFSTVLTTNDDMMLEQALKERGLSPSAYQIVSIGRDSDEKVAMVLDGLESGICIVKFCVDENIPLTDEIRDSLQGYLQQNIVVVGRIDTERHDIVQPLTSTKNNSQYYIMPTKLDSAKTLDMLQKRLKQYENFLIDGPNGKFVTFFDNLAEHLLRTSSPSLKSEIASSIEKDQPVEAEQLEAIASAPLEIGSLPYIQANEIRQLPWPKGVDVLIVTITNVELRAFLVHYPQRVRRTANGKTYYDLGLVGRARTVVVQANTMGPMAALVTVDEGIRALSPHAVIMAGIAFGLRAKEQQIGDILVSTLIQGYDLERVGTNENDQPLNHQLGACVVASDWLIDRFNTGSHEWLPPSEIHFGVILSGSKLVDNKEFQSVLLRSAPDAIGGEMEGGGLSIAANRHKVDWLLVKGISDWADGKRANKEEHQRLAAENAARFVLFVIAQEDFLPEL